MTGTGGDRISRGRSRGEGAGSQDGDPTTGETTNMHLPILHYKIEIFDILKSMCMTNYWRMLVAKSYG